MRITNGIRISLNGEVMVYESKYKAMLTDSQSAIEQIGSNSVVAIGQAVCQPPALMEALASRAEAANIDNVKVYYMHAEENMKQSLHVFFCVHVVHLHIVDIRSFSTGGECFH